MVEEGEVRLREEGLLWRQLNTGLGGRETERERERDRMKVCSGRVNLYWSYILLRC